MTAGGSPHRARSDAPRLALRVEEAAAALGISDETFSRYVRDELAVVRIGSIRLFPVTELERWLSERAERVLVRRPRSASPVSPMQAASDAGLRGVEKKWRK